MKQRLSVWMPNYNHSAYIGRAIEAIASQSRLPDEFVIVDDASTDTSKAVIEEYRAKYPWVRVIYSPKNRGVFAIMQQAVIESTGDYLFLTSADDYILPGFFQEAMQRAGEYPNAGIIFGQMEVESDTGKKMYVGKPTTISDSQFLSPKTYLEDYMKREAPNHCLSAATIYRTQALRDAGGFYAELESWSDGFTIQAIALQHGAYYIARKVAVWVVHTAGISQGVRTTPSRMFRVIRHTVRRMRSAQFAPYFPDSYVKQWTLQYRISVLTQYIVTMLGLSSVAMSPLFQKWHQNILQKIA